MNDSASPHFSSSWMILELKKYQNDDDDCDEVIINYYEQIETLKSQHLNNIFSQFFLANVNTNKRKVSIGLGVVQASTLHVVKIIKQHFRRDREEETWASPSNEVAACGHLLIHGLCADFEAICRILMRIQIDVRRRIQSLADWNKSHCHWAQRSNSIDARMMTGTLSIVLMRHRFVLICSRTAIPARMCFQLSHMFASIDAIWTRRESSRRRVIKIYHRPELEIVFPLRCWWWKITFESRDPANRFTGHKS